jgi:hypothetical protein
VDALVEERDGKRATGSGSGCTETAEEVTERHGGGKMI